MRKNLYLLLAVLAFLLVGCLSDVSDTLVVPNDSSNAGFANGKIPSSVLPTAVKNEIEKSMTINSGTTPPDISGKYRIGGAPRQVAGSSGAGEGGIIDQWVADFLGQDLNFIKDKSGKLSYAVGGKSSGSTVNVVGDGNSFTATIVTDTVIKTERVSDGIRVKMSTIISGIITDDGGISELDYAVVILDKGNDPYNEIGPVNAYKVFRVGGAEKDDGETPVTYKTVTIGDQTWMKENLNVTTTSGSWCYANKADSCAKYGRLYNWATAKTVCPTGWHLPSRDEWETLAKYVGSAAGKKLKATRGWYANGNGTDEFGFSALPGGIRVSDGEFDGVGQYGLWWTATEHGLDSAYSRDMDYDADDVFENWNDERFGMSVRCVKDGGTVTPPVTPTTTYKITFDANGGTAMSTSATTGTDGKLTSLPTPTRSGYTFDGWFTSTVGGTAVTTNTVFTENTTIYAQWTVVGTTTKTYTITFNANGGTVNVESAKTGTNGKLTSLPTPTRNDYTFKGWYTSTVGGTAVTTSTVFTENTTIYAQWTAVSVTPPVVGGDNCTSAATCKQVTIGTQTWMAENLNILTDESWCYGEGGQVTDSFGEKVTLSNSQIQANCTNYGRLYTWAAAKTACPTGWHLPSRDEWGTLAKYAGGTGTYGTSGTAGKTLRATSGWMGNGTDNYGFSALPGGYLYIDGSSSARALMDGYWWTSEETSDGGAYSRHMGHTIDYLSEGGSSKNYAYSVRCISDGGTVTPTTTYTITFNPNSGTVTPTTATTTTSGTLSSLPTPTRSGYTFNGWFTASTGGAEVTTSTVFTKNTTVYAQWTAASTSGGNLVLGNNEAWVECQDGYCWGLIFQANGLVVMVEEDYGIWFGCANGSGTWSTSGNRLTIEWYDYSSEEGTTVLNYSISGTKLNLTFDGDTETFTRTAGLEIYTEMCKSNAASARSKFIQRLKK